MTVEQKFCDYLSAFDGTVKGFSTIEPLFEALFHADFVLEENESTVSKEQMKQFQAKACNLGSKFTLLQLSALSPTTFEFKFKSTNVEWDITVHNIATIKDDKLYRASPVVDSGSKPLLLINFKTYVSAFNGLIKDFSEVAGLFDAIYHEDFTYNSESNAVNRQHLKQHHANFLKLGSKATLEAFKEINHDTIEFKLRIVNRKTDITIHNIAKLQGNTIISVMPVNEMDGVMTTIGRVSTAVDAEVLSKDTGKMALLNTEQTVTTSAAQ